MPERTARLSSSTGYALLKLQRSAAAVFTAELVIDQHLRTLTRTTEWRTLELPAPVDSVERIRGAIAVCLAGFPNEDLHLEFGDRHRCLEVHVNHPSATGKMDCRVSFEDELSGWHVDLVTDLSCLQELHDGLSAMIAS